MVFEDAFRNADDPPELRDESATHVNPDASDSSAGHGSASRSELRRWAALMAVAYAAVAGLRLLFVPAEHWRWRDDAVITLSHANGYALNGVPSVSSSGERVEGFSAPLQFAIATVYYALGGQGWQVLLSIQVVLGLVVLGYFVTRFLQHVAPASTAGMLVAVVATAIGGLLSWPSVGWLVSGMENSLTLPLLMAAMAGIASLSRDRGWALGLALGLAGVSRIEFAALLTPVLMYVLLMAFTHRLPVATATRVIGTAVAIWVAVNGWRLWTFGGVVANTARAQQRSLNLTQLAAVLAVIAVLVGFVALAQYRTRLAPLLLVPACLLVVSAASVGFLITGIGLPAAQAEQANAAAFVALSCGAYSLIAGALAVAGRSPDSVWIAYVLVAPTPIVQLAIFGPARLDAVRIAGMALPLLATSVGAAVLTLSAGRARRPMPTPRWLAMTLLAAGTASVAAVVIGSISQPWSKNLCCEIASSEQLLAQTRAIAVENDIANPILANPDLGKVSFPKETVTIDLGLLGSPLLTEANGSDSTKIPDLLNRVLAPDVVEAEGVWLCAYGPWITTESFRLNYRLRSVSGAAEFPDCPSSGGYSVWQRASSSAGYADELNLARSLQSAPEAAPEQVRDALVACAAADGDMLRCQAVRRAVERAGPALREAGIYASVVDEFRDASPAARLDELLLTTPPGWQGEAWEIVEPVLQSSDRLNFDF